MTRRQTSIAGGVIAAMAFAVPFLSSAQDRETQPGIAELGRFVAMGGAEQGGSNMACISRHGGEATGDGSGAFPRLAGQAGWYMYKQSTDYASCARTNDVMSGIATRLAEREMEAVSAYYAAIDAAHRPIAGDMDTGLLQWDGKLGAVGSAEKGIPTCVNCHGPSGTGNPPSVLYLVGQYANYMTYQMQLWREGACNNGAMNVMSSIARKMTEEDMCAVSDHYVRIRPAADTGSPNPAAPPAEITSLTD